MIDRLKKLLRGLGDWLVAREGLRPPLWRREVPAIAAWQEYFYKCFGGLAFLMFALQALSGLLLLVFYQPSAEGAWQGLMYLDNQAPGGWALRRLHAVGGNLLVLFALLHMLRVLWTSAYKAFRELHWLSGVLLLFCALASAASGQVLAWNQAGVELARQLTGVWRGLPLVGGDILLWLRGGAEVGEATLSRFFALHLAAPALMLVFLRAHWAMIRRNGVAGPL
ncbi:hypothetical protein AAU61_10680 [Desulfocarbo indianensis]|nr:hypothetical protein AAU61_10680 [Desulfocarbo indianensis]